MNASNSAKEPDDWIKPPTYTIELITFESRNNQVSDLLSQVRSPYLNSAIPPSLTPPPSQLNQMTSLPISPALLNPSDQPLPLGRILSTISIQRELSDHRPLLVKTKFGWILTWDIMSKMTERTNFFNNGFGLTETDRELKNRYQRIGKKISNLNKKIPLSIVSLNKVFGVDEAALNKNAEILRKKLSKKWEIALCNRTFNNTSSRQGFQEFGQVIIRNKNKTSVYNLTEADPTIVSSCLKPDGNQGRHYGIALTMGEQPFFFINSNQQYKLNTEEHLMPIINSTSACLPNIPMILAGNLNCNVFNFQLLKKNPDRYDFVHLDRDSSQTFNKVNRKFKNNNVDAVIIVKPMH